MTIAWVFSLLFLAFGFFFSPFARARDFDTRWSQRSILSVDANESYFASTAVPTLPPTWKVLDAQSLLDLGQEYESMDRDYLRHSLSGLASRDIEQLHWQRATNLSKKAFGAVRSYQLTTERERVIHWVLDLRNTNGIVKSLFGPLIAVMSVVATLSGNPIKIPVFEEALLQIRANLRQRNAKLEFGSPTLMGTFEMDMSRPGQRDALAGPPPDPIRRTDERFRLSVEHLLSPIFSNAFMFGGTTQVVGYTLAANLSSHLTFMFDSFFPLDPKNSDLKHVGQALRLRYELIL